jgi:Flp pilus assembly protein TadG
MSRRLLNAIRSRTRDDSGQVLAFFALALVVLVGMTALAIDVGYAYSVKRSLQASADAAATAGALELPDPAAAVSQAQAYGGNAGGKNRKETISDVTTTATTRCLPVAPCNPVNSVTVRESTTVKTFFARVLGFDTFKVSARATACSPCGGKPLDVMLVIDRTGSMCSTTSGAPDPLCTDLANARDGVGAFLQVMDPELDSVGLTVFPPASSSNAICDQPRSGSYDSLTSLYTLVPLSNDYLLNGQLNPSSALVQTVSCLRAYDRTSYATALERAQAELEARGNPSAEDVIVFLSDGGANYGPAYYSDSSPYRAQPCHQGIDSAGEIKAKGTTIYTIGYDIYDNGAGNCNAFDFSPERPAMTTESALRAIATSPEHAFVQPTASELKTIFTRIAVDLTGTRLVNDPEE